MYLIAEASDYPLDILVELRLTAFIAKSSIGTARCNYVGYFRPSQTDEAIFVLPKVFQKDGRLFGRYNIELFATQTAEQIVTPLEHKILLQLVELLYFSLRKHQRDTVDSAIIDETSGFAIRSSFGTEKTTPFEAMLSLIAFHRQNPYLWFQLQQLMLSRNPTKVDWKRTIDQTRPIYTKRGPVYLDMLGTRKGKSTDDPLLIIFYSLLREFHNYDPSIFVSPEVPTLSPNVFSALKPKIPRILRQVQNNYFSDQSRQLHLLLQTYFSASKVARGSQLIEFLCTDDYQIIFERMVDNLLSDPSLLAKYKHLKDGKQIDHLFGQEDVFGGNKIIYIGDSKYYKEPSTISSQRYKQFTYARNIIQENIYIINRGEKTLYSLNYRDELTEGYNVTPNFFVYGTVEPTYRESPAILRRDPLHVDFTYHFPNRLFDRDTLHVLYFQMDLVGLIRYNVDRGRRGRTTLRQQVRLLIQNELMTYLNERYDFYLVRIDETFISTKFKHLLGKLFRPPSLRGLCILALERERKAEARNTLALFRVAGIHPEQLKLADLSHI